MESPPDKKVSNEKNIEFTRISISKFWIMIILLSFSFSFISLGIDFNLINIDKFTLINKDTSKTIVDNSLTVNSSTDFSIKNLIDSTTFVNYSKTTQVVGGFFTKVIGKTNNDKMNLHNVMVEDMYGNYFFIKDFNYNKTVWYGECNEEFTNCYVYSSFLFENNKNEPICYNFNINNTETIGRYLITKNSRTDYFYTNPETCFDFEGIPPI